MKKILILSWQDKGTGDWFLQLACDNKISIVFVADGSNMICMGSPEHIDQLRQLCNMKGIKFVDL